jgi:hypothetical protein
MKYRFITIIHNLEIDCANCRDIKLESAGTISNRKCVLEKTFKNNLSIDTLGVHSIDEFNNQVFYYLDGTFDNNVTESEIHKRGTRFTYALLRLIQSLIFDFWKFKDNNLYIRDGFLYVYENQISDGYTFKGSLSSMPTFSDLNQVKSLFSENEIKNALSVSQNEISVENLFSDDFNYKEPTYDHFFKYGKSERTDRAWYFILNARNQPTLPMKIVSYCTALECLLTTSKTELVHRIAERVAILVDDETEKRVNTYNLIKKAYEIRSTIVHGAYLKGSNEDLKNISFEVDKLLRKLMAIELDVFSKKDDELDKYFIWKLMGKKVDSLLENQYK